MGDQLTSAMLAAAWLPVMLIVWCLWLALALCVLLGLVAEAARCAVAHVAGLALRHRRRRYTVIGRGPR